MRIAIVIMMAACASHPPREGVVTADPLCSLVDGHLDSWHGLERISHDRVPACFGAHRSQSTVGFDVALLFADEYERGRVLWVPNPGTVELIEIERDPAMVMTWTASLPSPEATHVYTESERAWARLDCAVLEERIWASRGLSVAIGRDAANAPCAARVRAFERTTVSRYLQDFVHFEPKGG
jgi:hypothetical protein